MRRRGDDAAPRAALRPNPGRGCSPRGSSLLPYYMMRPRRILMVDDEPGIRQSLGGVLEDEGYAVDGRRERRGLPGGAAGRRLRAGRCWISGCPASTAWRCWRASRRSRRPSGPWW